MPALQRQSSFDEPAYSTRINKMFNFKNALGQCLSVVAATHRHRGLQHDGAVIQRRRHEMHRAAVQLDTGIERLLMRFKSREARQQRRVNIEHAAAITLDEAIGQHPQKAGKHHQVGFEPVDLSRQLGIERCAVLTVQRVIDDRNGNTMRLRMLQSGGVGTVGNDCCDLRWPLFLRARAQEFGHVGTTTGNQDNNFLHRRILSSGPVLPPHESRKPVRAFII